ncbi:MAG: hypothetical protein J6U39_02410 [Clostridia bacterium]|nr:hypothetical protein [Clostridia bacterium]
MIINDDLKIYQLLGVLSEFGEKKGGDLLYEYWLKTNKLQYLPFFLDERRPPVSEDNLPYVVASENILESFIEEMTRFLVGCTPKCHMDDDTLLHGRELITQLEGLKRISFSSWAEFYGKLKRSIDGIRAITQRLLSAALGGRHPYNYLHNLTPIDFISPDPISHEEGKGKYFLLDVKGGSGSRG